MVWMSRAHRSFVGLDASSYISRCSLCEWCKTQRHNDTTTTASSSRYVTRSSCYRSGQASSLRWSQPSVTPCVSACLRVCVLRATAIYLLTSLSRSLSLSVSVSVDHRGGDCARP